MKILGPLAYMGSIVLVIFLWLDDEGPFSVPISLTHTAPPPRPAAVGLQGSVAELAKNVRAFREVTEEMKRLNASLAKMNATLRATAQALDETP